MSRFLSVSMGNVSTAEIVRPIVLVEAQFDSGTVFLWSGLGDLSWNAHTWQGTGALLKVDAVQETVEVKAVGTRITLNGIDTSMLGKAQNEDYQGRILKIYLGALDDSGSVISSPIVIFSGRMDVMTITDAGDTASIEVTVENRFIDFERTKERRYTDQDQKIEYPTDKGFEFVASIQDKEILWGRV